MGKNSVILAKEKIPNASSVIHLQPLESFYFGLIYQFVRGFCFYLCFEILSLILDIFLKEMMDHIFEMLWRLTDKMNIKRHLLHDIEPDVCLAVITSTPVYQRLQYHNKRGKVNVPPFEHLYHRIKKKAKHNLA